MPHLKINSWMDSTIRYVAVDKAHNYRVGFPAKTNHSICSLSFFNAPFYTNSSRLEKKCVMCSLPASSYIISKFAWLLLLFGVFYYASIILCIFKWMPLQCYISQAWVIYKMSSFYFILLSSYKIVSSLKPNYCY